MAVAVWTSFQQIADSTGKPYSGALVNVYAAGTTTPLTVYSDEALSVSVANPIVCDSSGQHAMRYIATASYKTTVTDSAATPLTNWSKDHIDPGVAVGSGALAVASGGTGATTAGGARTNLGAAAESTVTSLAASVAALQSSVTAVTAMPVGQCQLAKSGTALVLSPYNGNRLLINSTYQTVPDAGVSLAVGALGNTTLYYVYAYMVSTTMTLEAVTTAYAVQAGTGVKIKSGDATRTLAGICYLSGGAFVDSATQRFVRSYWNDPGIATLNSYSADRTTTSATYTEVNTEIRNEFLVWSGDIVTIQSNGIIKSSAAGQTLGASIGIDSATAEDTSAVTAGFYVNGADLPYSVSVFKTGLSEGYHYATVLGKIAGGSTLTFQGSATAGVRNTLRAVVRRA